MKSMLISKQNVKKLTNSHSVVSRTNNGPVWQLIDLKPGQQLPWKLIEEQYIF